MMNCIYDSWQRVHTAQGHETEGNGKENPPDGEAWKDFNQKFCSFTSSLVCI